MSKDKEQNHLRFTLNIDLSVWPELAYLEGLVQRGHRTFEATRLLSLGAEYDKLIKSAAQTRTTQPAPVREAPPVAVAEPKAPEAKPVVTKAAEPKAQKAEVAPAPAPKKVDVAPDPQPEPVVVSAPAVEAVERVAQPKRPTIEVAPEEESAPSFIVTPISPPKGVMPQRGGLSTDIAQIAGSTASSPTARSSVITPPKPAEVKRPAINPNLGSFISGGSDD